MNDWENPQLFNRNRLPARSYFIPYADESAALTFDRGASDRLIPLNGVWQFAAAKQGDELPTGKDLAEQVLVPYPIESSLSGIMRHEDRMFDPFAGRVKNKSHLPFIS